MCRRWISRAQAARLFGGCQEILLTSALAAAPLSEMSQRSERVVHWFRSDLRLRDNRALAAAAGRARELVLLYVLDDRLLRSSPPRARYLLAILERLARELAERGQRLVVERGDARVLVPRRLREWRAERITWGRDPSPYALRRDAAVRRAADALGVAVEEHDDRAVCEPGALRTKSGGAFRVYTPFRNAWWARFESDPPALARLPRLAPPLAEAQGLALPDAAALGVAGDATALPPAG
ncbi:MAG: hypothetical protein DCC71_13745, partial [Proteobacteria bacterium]